MELNDEQYSRIRDILYDDWGIFELDQLKILFKSHINSKRRFEKIKTLPSLFRVLEKRDILGPGHIESLNRVIQVCAPRNVEINNIISNRTGSNVYGHGMPNSLHSGSPIRMEQPGSPQDFSNYPIAKIANVIGCRIGSDWQELARALRMPEGQIDMLGVSSLSGSHIQLLLNYHYETYGTSWERWRTELQRGLVSVGRKDLSEIIDEILVFHPFNYVSR
ncbi:uncharacterized protein LOC109537323 [Dendroctonus ponderosae]